MKRILPIYFLSIVLLSFANGQIHHQKFYHLTRNSGLSQNTVNCIIKDAKGFMWFGTRDGLNKYNGYEFIYYQHKSNDPSSLSLGRVNELYVDSKGRMWVGTDQGGLNLYNPLKDNFQRYPCTQATEIDNTADVRGIHEMEDGKILVAYYSGVLSLFDPEKEEYTSFGDSIYPGLWDLAVFQNEVLYLATESGVWEIDGINKKKPEELDGLRLEGLGQSIFISLYLDPSRNCLWAGTYGEGAFCYNRTNGEIAEFSSERKAPYHLEHDIVRDFTKDDNNNLLIGTGGGGVHVWSPEENKMTILQHELRNQNSLNSNIIYSLFTDDNKNVWLGTYNGGVNVVFRHKDKFGHLLSYGGANELSNNSILAIKEDEDGKLWLGTDGGGLNYYDPETGEVQHFFNDINNPKSPRISVIKTILIDSKGVLWLGTFNEGLYAYDRIRKSLRHFYYEPDNPDGISSDHVWDVKEDAAGKIWIATLGGGLDVYDPLAGKFRSYANDPNNATSLSDNTLSGILFDRNGKLWVGTEFGGVCRLDDPEQGIFKVYSRLGASLINSNQIADIYEDSRGNIWVATIGGGLNIYDKEKDRFIAITKNENLASNLIYAITEDDEGNLWISTNDGISQFVNGVNTPQVYNFKNYTVGDGLQSNEFNTKSVCKTRGGSLYFGGVNGINHFKPSGIEQNEHIPPVVITDFKIFNQSVTINDQKSPLRVPISETREIVLNHKQSVFSFEFAALDFTNPRQNQYRFKLEGFEDEWNEVGAQRMATYTNLNPGVYTFRVQGSNNDGVWNLTGQSIKVTILAPFWKRLWFRILIIVFVSLIILGGFWWRVRDTEYQRRKLKSQVNFRTKELSELNTVLEVQNREIHSQQQELMHQKEYLEEINLEMARSHQKIQDQNKELENHRNNLQELVQQRTAELERAKVKAEESDRLKSSFLANMSHEIRTPLNAIVGFSSLLADEEVDSIERGRFMTQIRTNTDVLLVLIADILDLSKIESDQLDIAISEIELNTFFKGLVSSVKVGSDKVKLIADNQAHEENLILKSDRIRLNQILSNLLNNAIKFTYSGHVELGVKRVNNSLLFWVEDTGIGMSSEVVEKIFDRFYKYESVSSHVYRGTGLGLTITYSLVGLLGGEITVASEESKGSRFEVSLPL